MESTHSKRDIFVVADDLGLDLAINEGIFFAFKNGLIDGASLMANGEAFDDAVVYSKEVLGFKLGIHLVLVEEKSLTHIKFYKNHKIFFVKYILGLVNLKAIEKELETQIQKVLEAGIKPQFINSHQHLHLLPSIMDIVISLSKRYGISYIRVVNESVSLGHGKLFRQAQLLFLNFLSKLAKNKIRKAGLKYNDYFVGFINAGKLKESDIKKAEKLAQKYSGKIIELGCHPGYGSEGLREKYKHWKYSWQTDLDVLKNKND